MGYWWIERGGDRDSIHDAERLRDELLRITWGVWDFIKNRNPATREEAANWAVDWIQFLPAKRESRRYLGDHVLTQNEVEAEGRFDDLVAYGGWTMDDHHPAGFRAARLGAPATVFHPAPAPYGIPYRCLYSRNVANLMFAGRVASCTHAAMSSTRVQGTGAVMGQAAGTAAAMAMHKGLSPRGVGDHVRELQQQLLADDAYLPWHAREMPELTRTAELTASQGDPEPVRDGVTRPVGDNTHAWECSPGDWVAYTFGEKKPVGHVTLVLDSGLDRNVAMSHHHGNEQLTSPPPTLPRILRVEGLFDGRWRPIETLTDNHQRLVRIHDDEQTAGVRLVVEKTWGADRTRVYGFTVE
jgi:hypothetical protein